MTVRSLGEVGVGGLRFVEFSVTTPTPTCGGAASPWLEVHASGVGNVRGWQPAGMRGLRAASGSSAWRRRLRVHARVCECEACECEAGGVKQEQIVRRIELGV